MSQNGYDDAKPIIVWDNNGSLIVVDGHTRLQAAKEASLNEVFVAKRKFQDKREALEAAIAEQRDRRNLTRQEILAAQARAVRALDRLKPVGRKPDKSEWPPIGGLSNTSSAAETAAKIPNTSERTIERIRAVFASNEEDIKEELLAGKIAPTTADEKIKRRGRARKTSRTNGEAKKRREAEEAAKIAKEIERQKRASIANIIGRLGNGAYTPVEVAEAVKPEQRYVIDDNIDMAITWLIEFREVWLNGNWPKLEVKTIKAFSTEEST